MSLLLFASLLSVRESKQVMFNAIQALLHRLQPTSKSLPTIAWALCCITRWGQGEVLTPPTGRASLEQCPRTQNDVNRNRCAYENHAQG